MEAILAFIAIVGVEAAFTIINVALYDCTEGSIGLGVDGEKMVVLALATEIVVRALLTTLNIARVSELLTMAHDQQSQHYGHYLHE